MLTVMLILLVNVIPPYNYANDASGALISITSNFTTKENSTVVFHNNNSTKAGAIGCSINCNIIFNEYS